MSKHEYSTDPLLDVADIPLNSSELTDLISNVRDTFISTLGRKQLAVGQQMTLGTPDKTMLTATYYRTGSESSEVVDAKDILFISCFEPTIGSSGGVINRDYVLTWNPSSEEAYITESTYNLSMWNDIDAQPPASETITSHSADISGIYQIERGLSVISRSEAEWLLATLREAI